MPLFKLFSPEPEGIVITAPLFTGTGDIVSPTGEGSFTIPAPRFTGISWGEGVFEIPAPTWFGTAMRLPIGAGSFIVSLPMFTGTGVGEDPIENPVGTGVFEIPAPIFAGTAQSIPADGIGEFTLCVPMFSGFGGRSSEYEIDPNEGIDLMLNITQRSRVI